MNLKISLLSLLNIIDETIIWVTKKIETIELVVVVTTNYNSSQKNIRLTSRIKFSDLRNENIKLPFLYRKNHEKISKFIINC